MRGHRKRIIGFIAFGLAAFGGDLPLLRVEIKVAA
jgi:hypothetical protein